MNMHQQNRREALAVAFFVLASALLWAGSYGLSKIRHNGKTYVLVWVGSTCLIYLISVVIWNLPARKRRRQEPDPETEYTQMNPPAELPPTRFS